MAAKLAFYSKLKNKLSLLIKMRRGLSLLLKVLLLKGKPIGMKNRILYIPIVLCPLFSLTAFAIEGLDYVTLKNPQPEIKVVNVTMSEQAEVRTASSTQRQGKAEFEFNASPLQPVDKTPHSEIASPPLASRKPKLRSGEAGSAARNDGAFPRPFRDERRIAVLSRPSLRGVRHDSLADDEAISELEMGTVISNPNISFKSSEGLKQESENKIFDIVVDEKMILLYQLLNPSTEVHPMVRLLMELNVKSEERQSYEQAVENLKRIHLLAEESRKMGVHLKILLNGEWIEEMEIPSDLSKAFHLEVYKASPPKQEAGPAYESLQ